MEVSYSDVFSYLQHGQYPDGVEKNRKRAIRKKALKFTIRNGVLYFNSGKNSQEWVPDKVKQQQIIQSAHGDKLGGHFGRDKTREKITSRYYWNSMTSRDIDSFVKSCITCQRVNKKLERTPARLHPISVDGPWHRIGIDLIGPLPITSSGNLYIVTCCDYFTKWPEAAAIPEKSAKCVASFIYKLITVHGSPAIIQSDQGREFINEVNAYLFQLTGVEHKISAPYHPQTNGLDERFNQTLINALTKMTGQKKDDWDMFIDAVLFGYRTSQQSSSRFTPFELMYKRKARLPIEVHGSSSSADVATCEVLPNETVNEYMEKMMNWTEKCNEAAKGNIEKAQKRQKKHFDAKHQSPNFKVGDMVWLYNSRKDTRKGGKLENNWKGPYEIAEQTTRGTYRLKNEQGMTLKQAVSSIRLKVFLDKELTNTVTVEDGGPGEANIVDTNDEQRDDTDMSSNVTMFDSHKSASAKANQECKSIAEKKGTGRKTRCGVCDGCKSTDCGKCNSCLDKPRFGGAGRKKKACDRRECTSIMKGPKVKRKKTTVVLPSVVEWGEDAVIFSSENHVLNYHDIMVIANGEWLDDNIVNHFMSVLARLQSVSSCKVLPSQVFVKLKNDDFNRIEDYFKLCRFEVMTCELFLLPCCNDNHWMLVEINVKKKLVSIYDSIGGYSNAILKEIRSLVSWLGSMYGERYTSEKFQFNTDTAVVRQTNGSDCGVFVCKYADLILDPDFELLTPSSSFNNSQFHIRTWLLNKLFGYHRQLKKDGLRNEVEIQTMLESIKQCLSSESAELNCPLSAIVDATAVKSFFKEYKNQLAAIAKGDQQSPLLEAMQERKFRSAMKTTCAGGIAYKLLSTDDFDELFKMCYAISKEHHSEKNNHSTFSLALDVLLAEGFIHYLMELKEISYDEASDIYFTT